MNKNELLNFFFDCLKVQIPSLFLPFPSFFSEKPPPQYKALKHGKTISQSILSS